MKRRTFLKTAAGMGVGAMTALAQAPAGQAPATAMRTAKLKQSVTRGVFGRGANFEETCKLAADIGIKGYDLIGRQDWPTLKKYGLTPTMVQISSLGAPGGAAGGPGGAPSAARGPGGEQGRGGAGGGPATRGPGPPSGMELSNKEYHDEHEKLLRAGIDELVANGAPNIIVFAGYRTPGGITDQEAADNCVAILKRIKAYAEDKGINICMEYLNSRVNHRGYIFDHMDWGVEVMTRVDSPRIGMLYDIYHAQVDDGDVVRSIRNNIKWIKHFHTAGNPGRNQLDDNQELNYRFIARAIADLNFTGYIGHEYSPTQGADPAACLKQAFEIFNI